MKEKIIDFLLANANPSIVYRVKSEILNEDITIKEKDRLQAKIMAEPIIQLIVNSQQENGWIGNNFHGAGRGSGNYDNQEVATKYLGEKLVYKHTPVLKRAMEAFVTTELTDLCYGTRGRLYDEFKYAANGQNIIRCACISRAGYDDEIDIKPQIQLALDSFKRVLEVDSVLDVVRKISKKPQKSDPRDYQYVFKDYEKWPCYYHLSILAHTSLWKTDENIQVLANAVKRLMRTDRSKEVQVGASSWVGHVLGTTGCYAEGHFHVGIERNGLHYTVMDRLEWLCRCGIAPYVKEIENEVEIIKNSINANGICEANIDENRLKGFSTYSGQQLEVDWKSVVRRQCDISFRALLVLYYSKC